MRHLPQPNEVYRHFKGNKYQVVALAQHTESGEMLVVYQALYGEYKIFARPLSMFMEPVDREKYPEADQPFRFELESGERNPSPAAREQSPAAEEQFPAEALTAAVRETEQEPEQREGGFYLDPLVIQFLDAGTYEERLSLLAALHSRITRDMLTTMAMAVDVEIEGQDVEEGYEQLKTCLLTFEKYECQRLR